MASRYIQHTLYPCTGSNAIGLNLHLTRWEDEVRSARKLAIHVLYSYCDCFRDCAWPITDTAR
jgi:hypothetical protein